MSSRSLFSPKEDEKLIMLVERCGKKVDWRTISFDMEGRTPRQCRERYNNYLNPNLNKQEWTHFEDEILISQYNKIGSKWQQISEMFAGRTAAAVRNRFLLLKKKQNSNFSRSDSTTDSEYDMKSEVKTAIVQQIPLPLFEIPKDSIFYCNV